MNRNTGHTSPSTADIYAVHTKAPGPAGRLPLTTEMLRERPSGDLFGLSQDAGMGWNVNIPLPGGAQDRHVLRALDEVFIPLMRRYEPELI
ncbi:MAG: hypothetical protein M1608_13180, partial [Candidatus Omnitrophica bacterium]|nr:hypothetical protein [Candidatus Omnitrophota bacterium]